MFFENTTLKVHERLALLSANHRVRWRSVDVFGAAPCFCSLSKPCAFTDRLCAQAFTEVRKYPVKPGKMDEWVRIMEDMIIP